MLFDLRARGRRRTVQAVYLSLAILMGGGLVFFGIGGEVQGGLFDAFSESSQGTEASKQIERQIKRAEAAVRANPRDPQRLANLARLRYQAAGIGGGFDENAQRFTAEGRAKLRGAAQAWERYLALEPSKPDDRVASLMVQAYGAGGLNRLDDAVRAQEVITERRRPNSNLFAQLAVLAYQAGQTRKGDLAAARAVELADKDERTLLRQQLEQSKMQAQQQAVQGARGGQGGQPGAPQGQTPPPPGG